MSDDDPTPDDGLPAQAGYGKPPVAHRFKTGVSGNPRGRPRKAVSTSIPHALSDSLAVDHVLLGEAYRTVTLREGDQPVTLTTVSAVYRTMALSGMKGNRLAAKTFVEQVEKAEGRRRAQALEIIDIAATYKHDWSYAIESARRRGVEPPTVYPHPDDIDIGSDGLPYYVGPKSAAEQAHWDKLQARAQDADEAVLHALAGWNSKLKRDAKYKPFHFDEMVYEHRIRVMLRYAAPDEATRRALRYRRPTESDIRQFVDATKAKYALYKDCDEAQIRAFIREIERYETSLG